jgi:hypothetical protein
MTRHLRTDFSHRALALREERRLIYTAMSKHFFCYRTLVSKFVFEQHGVPVNPALNFDFGFHGLIKKDDVLTGNNNLLRVSDEIWIFGPVSDGVYAEMILADEFGLRARYFEIDSTWAIREISSNNLIFEPDVGHALPIPGSDNHASRPQLRKIA